MLNVNFSIERISLIVRHFLRKRISIKFAIVIVLIILMPYILRFLNRRMIDSESLDVYTFLFSIGLESQIDLDNDNSISKSLWQEFENNGISLSRNATISVEKKNSKWLITDSYDDKEYIVKKGKGKLNVYGYTSGGLGIKDLIRRVKLELEEAEKERRENRKEALFELQDFDLELSFVVKARSTQKGKVEYHFVTVDSETETNLERIQKIKLHMKANPPQNKKQGMASSPISTKEPNNIISSPRPLIKGGTP